MKPWIYQNDLTTVVLLIGSLLCLFPAACAEIPIYIIKMDPYPDIHLERKADETLALIIAESIPDEFMVPEIEDIRPLKVKEWRSTLEAGFRNGFGDLRKIVPSGADQTLEILRADPRMVPKTEVGFFVHSAAAQVTYHARIQDKTGVILKQSWGTVEASKRVRNAYDSSRNMTDAVARMYEKIALDLLAP